MGQSIKSIAKIAMAPIKAFYDPVGAIKDVFGGVRGIFAGLTATPKTAGGQSSEPSSQTVRSSKSPVRFILGRVSTGGVLAWIQEQAGSQANGEWVHIVYVLSEGVIAGVDEILVDEQTIASLGVNATYEVIKDPSQPNAFLLANCPDWKPEQIGRGLSFVRVSFKYDAEKFPSGMPSVRFIVRGRNDIYDPRSATYGYSDNTALLILWYLRNRCAIPDDEIIFETFASAANVCDESVSDPSGNVTPRYFAGAVIGADERRNSVLDDLLSACAGSLIRVGGRWSLQAGAYYGPADFTITEDMVIGTVEGTTEVSNSDAINTVRGTFVDPSQAWADTDYPTVSVPSWVESDGGELAESLSFTYVTDAYLAQRLANITLRRRRSGGSLSVPLNFNGYNCRPGRAVTVNLPSLNILGEFIVTDWSMGALDACTVSLKPYEQAIFDDAVGEPYNPLGFISLPTGGIGSVTGLAWAPSTDAEVVQGVLSWTSPPQAVLSYTVTIRLAGETVQSIKVGGDALSCNINGLQSGVYAISVTCYGPGAASGETTITVSIDVPPVPESCTYQSTIDTITLFPSNTQHGLNGGTYEYFYSLDAQTPAAQAEYLGQGLSLTHTGLAFFTNYYYFIRSKNAYGVSGFLKVPASTSTDVETMLEALAGKIEKGQLYPELVADIEKISGDGPDSVNERLEQAKDEIYERIDELTDALAYDPGKAYAAGDIVRDGQHLYQARVAVPEGASPPDPTYWIDIGTILETANALARQVQQNSTDISDIDGKVTASASQLQALQASARDDDGEGELADAMKGWDSTAKFADEVRVRASQNEATVTRLTSLDAQVAGNKAGISSLEQVVATNEKASASRLDQLKAEVDDNAAQIQEVSEVQVDAEEAVASLRTNLSSVYTAGRDDTGEGDLLGALEAAQSQAKFASETRTLADADQALARRSDTLEASINRTGDSVSEVRASVQQVSQAVVGVDGRVSAISSWKTETNSKGKKVQTGIVQGSDGSVGEILMQADRIALINGLEGDETDLIVFEGGKMYLNTAFINTAFIQQLILGMTLRSQAVDSKGRPLIELNMVNGTFTVRGQDANGSTLLNNGGVYVYDVNEVERTAVGRLT